MAAARLGAEGGPLPATSATDRASGPLPLMGGAPLGDTTLTDRRGAAVAVLTAATASSPAFACIEPVASAGG